MASTHALAGCQACIFALNCLVEGKSHTLNAKANAICISSAAAIVARGGNSTPLALLSAAAGMHLAWQLINDLSTEHTRGTHTHGDSGIYSDSKNLGESHSHPCRSSSAPQLTDDCLSFVSVLFCFFFLPDSIRDLSRTCCWRLCIIYDPFCNCPILYVCTLQRFNDSPGL